MTTEEIYNVLMKNGVRISAEFADLIRRGYDSDAAQKFSDEIVEDMSRITEHGANYGFNGSMKDTIDLLADIALSLGKHNVTAKLPKLRARRDEAIARMKPTKADGTDVRAPVLEFITTSLEGLDIIEAGSAEDERLRSFAAESRKKLEDLRSAVRSVVNSTSVAAAEKADRMIEYIGYWRNSAAVRLFDSTALECLDDALEVAGSWKALSVKGDRVKPDKAPQAPRDEMYRIASSGKAREALDGLRSEVRRKISKVDEINERRASLIRERGECNAELDNIAVEWQNGKVDDMTADMRSTALESRIAAIDRELGPLEMRIGLDSEVLSVCRDLESILAQYEDDPAMLYVIAQQVDFGRVNAFLMGHLDAATGRRMLDDIATVIAAETEARRGMIGIIEDYRKVEEERNRGMQDLVRETKERLGADKVRPESARDRMAERMKKRAGRPEEGGAQSPERIDLTGETGELRKEDL